MLKFGKFRAIAAAAAAGVLLAAGSPSECVNWYFTKRPGEAPVAVGGGYDEILKETGAIWYAPTGEKKIYLTFDAGYANENVETIIDVLTDRGTPATFFILPGIIRNSPEVVRKMIDGGFIIGNHSTHHSDMSRYSGEEEFRTELEGVEKLFYEFSGREMSKYFRPPEGKFSVRMLELCRENGYIPVFWSYAYADWDNSAQPDPARSLEKLIDNAHDGMVLLLHPTGAANAAVLGGFIDEMTSRGYTFGSLDEIRT